MPGTPLAQPEAGPLDLVVRTLVERLHAPDPGVRAGAARQLAEIGSVDAQPAIMSVLRDADPEVRLQAVRALVAPWKGRPGQQPRGVTSVLRRALHDPHEGVREAAHAGLVAVGVVSPGRTDAPGAVARAEREALRQRLRAASMEEAAEILFERGRTLAGRPLERASWSEIARGIPSARSGERILEILVTAVRREQVVRALRLSRACARPRRRAGGAGAGSHGGARPSIASILVVEERGQEWQDDDQDWPFHTDDWRGWSAREGRYPGILAVSAVEEVLASFVERIAAPTTPADFAKLRARLTDAERAHLRAAVGAAREGLPDEIEAFLARHGHDLLGRIADPGEPIHEGLGLALLALLELHGLGPEPPGPVIDWRAVASWIAARILQPDLEAGDRPAVVLAYLRFVEKAPGDAMADLRDAFGRVHRDWDPLFVWLHARRGDDTWKALVQASLGSTLVHRDLRENLVELRAHDDRRIKIPEPRHPWMTPPRALLANGGGTLLGLDYPSFRVVSRPSLSLVRPETAAAIDDLAGALALADASVLHRSCGDLLADLFAVSGGGVYATLPEPSRRAIARAVEDHAVAFVVLDNIVFASSPEPVRVRRRHVRRFLAERPPDAPADLAALRERFDGDRVKEGLVHALLDQIHEPWVADPALQAALKEGFVHALRTVALTYGLDSVACGRGGEEPLQAAQRLLDLLVQQMVHAPLELIQALGMTHEQGLPRLSGGHATLLERRFRQVLRDASLSARIPGEAAEPPTVFECSTLDKLQALDRGDLGRDCSSGSVPLRALSPHHVYYGIYQGSVQQPGYMTVYEAWAVEGERRIPVLCLETINAPLAALDAVQQDLVVIFEAIARSRGLHPELVLITGLGTWNYRNGWLLESGRRFRKGRPVALLPADPVSWRLYEMTAGEAAYYSAFSADQRGDLRILAPFDPELDPVQPENLDEARRIAARKPGEIVITARTADGPVGFISAYPDQI